MKLLLVGNLSNIHLQKLFFSMPDSIICKCIDTSEKFNQYNVIPLNFFDTKYEPWQGSRHVTKW